MHLKGQLISNCKHCISKWWSGFEVESLKSKPLAIIDKFNKCITSSSTSRLGRMKNKWTQNSRLTRWRKEFFSKVSDLPLSIWWIVITIRSLGGNRKCHRSSHSMFKWWKGSIISIGSFLCMVFSGDRIRRR